MLYISGYRVWLKIIRSNKLHTQYKARFILQFPFSSITIMHTLNKISNCIKIFLAKVKGHPANIQTTDCLYRHPTTIIQELLFQITCLQHTPLSGIVQGEETLIISIFLASCTTQVKTAAEATCFQISLTDGKTNSSRNCNILSLTLQRSRLYKVCIQCLQLSFTSQ